MWVKKHWKCFEGKLDVPSLLSVARAEPDSEGIYDWWISCPSAILPVCKQQQQMWSTEQQTELFNVRYIVSYLKRMALERRKHKKMYLLWHVSHFVLGTCVSFLHLFLQSNTRKIAVQKNETEFLRPPFYLKMYIIIWSLGSFPPKSLL